MLQLCVALKIVVANRLVWHHLKVESLIKSDRCSYYTGYWTIYSFKIFRRFWLAPFLRLIFHNQRALTIRTFIRPGKSEQFTNDSMVYLIGIEASWAIDQRPKWRLLLSEDEIDEFLTKTERKKCKSAQNVLLDECDLLFWDVSARCTTCLYRSYFISWNGAEKWAKV